MFPIDPKVFGYTCFVRDVCPQVSKLDLKSLKCIFVGYSCVQKGYRCYCPTLQRYFVSTDVTFFETIPFSLSSPVTSQGEGDDLLVYTISSSVPPAPPAPLAPPTPTPALIPVKPPITQVYSRCHNPPVFSPTLAASSLDPVQNNNLSIALCKSRRQCAHPISSFVSYNHFLFSSCSFIASLDSISFPNTVYEVLSHPGWRSAMVDEMQALDDNGTWDLVPLPIGKNDIGCLWVFAVKFNPDGSVARLNTRLVAKGNA